MGLDMYLDASFYLCENSKPKQFEDCLESIDINASECSSVVVFASVMYWRKANHIHKWFVDNVQKGNDNCARYNVPRGSLLKLRDLCKKVCELYREGKHDEISEIMPTTSGFFFGSTDFDIMFFNKTEETEKVLTKLLTDKRFSECEFYYTSSW